MALTLGMLGGIGAANSTLIYLWLGVLMRNPIKVRRIFTIQSILHVNLRGRGKSSNKEELGERLSTSKVIRPVFTSTWQPAVAKWANLG